MALFMFSGNMVPTKKGISLTEQQWESFMSHRLDIEKLLDLVKSDKGATKVPQQEEEKDLFCGVCEQSQSRFGNLDQHTVTLAALQRTG